MMPLAVAVAFATCAIGMAGGYAMGARGKAEALAAAHDAYQRHREAAAANAARWDAQQRAIEARRIHTVQEAADAAHLQAAAARADADQLERTAGVLRAALIAAYAGPASHGIDPAAAQGGQAATGPGLVLPELFERFDPRLRSLAAAFDQAHAAGLACERAYLSLTP